MLEERILLPISDVRAVAIQRAVRGVLESLSIEEKFNLVLENFEEFERELLGGALSRSLFQVEDWSSHMTELHRLNRRLVNFLATSRLYVDQVPHNLSNLFGSDAPIATAFKESKSREYDTKLGYRVMEAMRNYIQHRSLPIHVISYQTQRRDRPDGSLREHTLTAEVHPQQYREDGKFKAEILTELEQIGDRVELTPLVRQCVAGLASVHADLRTLLAPHELTWDTTVRACDEDFQAAGGSDLTGLALVDRKEGDTYVTVVHVSAGPVLRRQWLKQKNRYVEHYERTLVANRETA